MKQNAHPTWYNDCVVTCSCGSTFTTGATMQSIQVDICSACHPFFTGEMKFVDRQGRVDKFMQKMKAAQTKQTALSKKKAAKAKRQQAAKQGEEEDKTYQEILREKKSNLRKQNSDKIKASASSK